MLQWFWTELGTPQRIEVQKVSWINVYFQSIWLSVVGKLHLTLTFSGKAVCIWRSKGNQSHCLHKMKENIDFQNTFYVSYHLKHNLRVSMNHWNRLHVAVSHWFSDWLWKFSHPSSYFMIMHVKIQFYNPVVQTTTPFKTFGLVINHAW